MRQTLNSRQRRCFSAIILLTSIFHLIAAQPVYAQSFNYQINAVGPDNAYSGYNVYFELQPIVLSGSMPTDLYQYSSVTLSNLNVAFDVDCSSGLCSKNASGQFQTYRNDASILRVAIPAGLAPGQYSVNVVMSNGGTQRSVMLPLRVQSPPAPLPSPVLGSIPIPGLAKWESTLSQLGAKWCGPATVYSYTDYQQIWYYDGARVYFQMADYTGDRSWEACAFNVARQYRDYVVANGGRIMGSNVFTAGLRMAYERSGDASYKQAAVSQSKNGTSALFSFSVRDGLIRETAYIVNAYVDAEKLGEPRHPNLSRDVDYLIGHYDAIFLAGDYSIHQTVYDALAAEALINYYELTKDPRIPAIIKTMLDWTWDYGWNKSTYQLLYNPEPFGPKCAVLCQAYATDMVNLTAPAFAWYWKVSGNPVYQQRGDEMFQHALDTDISYSGKVFSQNFRWSYDYVRWRKAATNCTYSVTPESAWTASAGGASSLQVTTQPGCSWTASSSAPWAVVTSGSNGNSSGSVNISVTANGSPTARSATLNAAGTIVTLRQDGAAAVAVSVGLAPPAVVESGALRRYNKVMLSGPAPASGALVALSSSDASRATVPATVTVPAGATFAYFDLRAGAVGASVPVTITASYGGSSGSASVTIRQAAISSILLASSSMSGGTTLAGNRVNLDGIAPAGGTAVTLRSSNTTIATALATITVPAGANYADFSITGVAAGSVTITASENVGWTGASTTLSVTPPAPVSTVRVSLIRTGPLVSSGAVLRWNIVTLTAPAPAGGALVTLASSNPAAASVPATLAIPAGVKTGFFNVQAGVVNSPTAVTITAAYGGESVSAAITVQPR